LSGRTIDARTIGAVADKVIAMTLATQDPAWTLWVLDLYRRTSSVPSLQVADRLAEAAIRHSMAVRGALGNLLDLLQQSVSFRSDDEIEAMTRLQRTRVLVQDQRLPGDKACDTRDPTDDWPGISD
jgi:hypothetical protein